MNLIFLLNALQIDGPEEGKVVYWILGVLVLALGAALGYVKTQHKEQLVAKNMVIKNQDLTISYERSEKEKAQQDYKDLVSEFNSIFQQQDLIRGRNG